VTATQVLSAYFSENLQLTQLASADQVLLSSLKKTISLVTRCLTTGHKLLIAGNGGSAAQAQHFSGEIVGRYKRERRGYPAISLSADTSVLTAWANDYDYRTVFSRQVEALGRPGDVFICFSTSGNSANLVEAASYCRRHRIAVVSFLGRGGKLSPLSNISLIIPSSDTPRIQELHSLLAHIICEEVEKSLA
jgi:D-sedoheptulose 7-phosphate isomerase